jgi:hypothetical protein
VHAASTGNLYYALVGGIDCHACHETGLIAVADAVRDVVERYPDYYSEGDLAAIRTIYPGASRFGQLLTEGSQLHLDALQRAGVVPNGPEPISFVYYQFERGAIGLRRAAGELDVTPEELRAAITSTGGALAPLLAPDGVIQRSTFDSAYVATRCALEAESRNRPVACP